MFFSDDLSSVSTIPKPGWVFKDQKQFRRSDRWISTTRLTFDLLNDFCGEEKAPGSEFDFRIWPKTRVVLFTHTLCVCDATCPHPLYVRMRPTSSLLQAVCYDGRSTVTVRRLKRELLKRGLPDQQRWWKVSLDDQKSCTEKAATAAKVFTAKSGQH